MTAVLFAAEVSTSEPATRLNVKADAAVVPVSPLPQGRHLIRLPALDFVLDIQAVCPGEQQPESLSVAIADSQKNFAEKDINGRTTIVATITVPHRQVGPLAVDGFCALNEYGPATLRIRDAYTAQLSLRCSDDDAQSIAYLSQPLDIELACDRPEPQVEDAEEDQDSLSGATTKL